MLVIVGMKFDGMVGFGGGMVGEVGMVGVFFGEVVECFVCFLENFIFLVDQFGLEIGLLIGIYEFFVFRKDIFVKFDSFI